MQAECPSIVESIGRFESIAVLPATGGGDPLLRKNWPVQPPHRCHPCHRRQASQPCHAGRSGQSGAAGQPMHPAQSSLAQVPEGRVPSPQALDARLLLDSDRLTTVGSAPAAGSSAEVAPPSPGAPASRAPSGVGSSALCAKRRPKHNSAGTTSFDLYPNLNTILQPNPARSPINGSTFLTRSGSAGCAASASAAKAGDELGQKVSDRQR